MAHQSFKQPACANCQYAFVPVEPDEFCPRCGQQNHAVDISFHHVAEEFLEGIFHFDGKVFRTAGLLLFKPGELTRRFLGGHRVPYVPPIRLYVFISFVFFFLLSLQASHPKRGAHAKVQMSEEQVVVDSMMAAFKPSPDSTEKHLGPAAKISLGDEADPQLTKGSSGVSSEKFSLLVDYLSREEFDQLPDDLSNAQADSVLRSKNQALSLWNRVLLRRLVRWRDVTTEELSHQALRGLPIAVFLLMPLVALLLKGLYFRRERYYIGHLIFTVHLHCFIFLFFTLLLLMGRVALVKEVVTWIWWLPLVYVVLALRRFYQQSWRKTLLKSAILGIAYWLTVMFSLVSVMLFGALVA